MSAATIDRLLRRRGRRLSDLLPQHKVPGTPAQNWTETEKDVLKESRWRSLEEIRSTRFLFALRELAELLGSILFGE
jgi:hypothetical protein